MMKDLSRAALHEEALAAKPELLYEPMREIHVYRDLLDGAGLGTAEYHGSSIDPAQDRWWLFIENVVGDALWQIGEFDVWEEAARWLARMHGDLGRRVDGRGPLLRYDRDLLGVWARRASGFADDPRSTWSTEDRQRVRELTARYDAVTEQLAALAPTFIHGEFYPSNVLVQQGGRTPRVCPIDWEIAAVGPGLLDLAALSVGKWTDAERARLAVAYRDGCRAGCRDRLASVGRRVRAGARLRAAPPRGAMARVGAPVGAARRASPRLARRGAHACRATRRLGCATDDRSRPDSQRRRLRPQRRA